VWRFLIEYKFLVNQLPKNLQHFQHTYIITKNSFHFLWHRRQTHNSFFTFIIYLNLKKKIHLFSFSIYFLSFNVRKKHVSPSIKLPPSRLFYYVVLSFDFIWLCYIIKDVETPNLRRDVMCQIWVENPTMDRRESVE